MELGVSQRAARCRLWTYCLSVTEHQTRRNGPEDIFSASFTEMLPCVMVQRPKKHTINGKQSMEFVLIDKREAI